MRGRIVTYMAAAMLALTLVASASAGSATAWLMCPTNHKAWTNWTVAAGAYVYTVTGSKYNSNQHSTYSKYFACGPTGPCDVAITNTPPSGYYVQSITVTGSGPVALYSAFCF